MAGRTDFFHPPRGWKFDRVEGGNRVFRKELEMGMGSQFIGGGITFVFGRKGVKEWDGHVLRAWVEITSVGVQWADQMPAETLL